MSCQAKLDTMKKQFEDQRSQNELLVKELRNTKTAAARAEKDLKKARGTRLWTWSKTAGRAHHISWPACRTAAVIKKSKDKQQLSLVLEEKDNYEMQAKALQKLLRENAEQLEKYRALAEVCADCSLFQSNPL